VRAVLGDFVKAAGAVGLVPAAAVFVATQLDRGYAFEEVISELAMILAAIGLWLAAITGASRGRRR
jgi:hypothetical protein